MKRLIVLSFAILVLIPQQICAVQLIKAASGSVLDVTAAISLAKDGDVVEVPAGLYTWSMPLTISKGITLQGGGTNNTRIQGTGPLIRVAPLFDVPIRVTGVYFSFNGFDQSVDRSAIAVARPLSNLRVDHCRFDYGKRVLYTTFTTYGVIDHCFFYNNDIAIAPESNAKPETGWGDTEWAKPVRLGTTNTLVVEDCTFLRDVPVEGNEILYGQSGAKAVFRFNTVTQTGPPLDWIDAHGYLNSPNGPRGTICYEVYSNRVSCASSYRLLNLRGGTHLIYGNTITSPQFRAPQFQLRDEGLTSFGSASPKDYHTNSFYWGNTYNSQPIVPTIIHPAVIKENLTFFQRRPQAGDPFYPYIPLVYPHPRVTAEDRPRAPEGLKLAN